MDFTKAKQFKKGYSGAGGSKLSVMHNDKKYMVKFPADKMCAVTEYLACKIYESIGISVQEVMLGTYMVSNGNKKIVVLCKDFGTNGFELQNYVSCINGMIDLKNNWFNTELSVITQSFKMLKGIEEQEISDRFWDMFIVDALIANENRTNDNWGVLYNQETDEIQLAPVYGCSKSLFYYFDESMVDRVLENATGFCNEILKRSISAIKENGERIDCFKYISSRKNEACCVALERISKRIDLDIINGIIEQIPYITDKQKQFYKLVIKERKKYLIDCIS